MTVSNGEGGMDRAAAVAEAFRLHTTESRSTRYIAEELTRRGYKVTHNTVAAFIKEAREAEPFLDLLDPALNRREQAGRLQAYAAIVLDEIRGGRADPLPAIDLLLKIETRFAKLGGWDAPTRIATQNENRPAQPDARVLQALQALQAEQEREEAERDD